MVMSIYKKNWIKSGANKRDIYRSIYNQAASSILPDTL
jgi:hypothetical protein